MTLNFSTFWRFKRFFLSFSFSNRFGKKIKLISSGALINVKIIPPEGFIECVGVEKKDFPCLALIDTGANISAIDEEIVKQLGLKSNNLEERIIKDIKEVVYTFDIGIEIESGSKPFAKYVDAVGIEKDDSTKYNVLIGRDFLNHCKFYYDGKDNYFILKAYS